MMIKNQELIEQIKAGLEQRYLAPMRENPEVYIGVELEFPLVHLKGQATDVAVTKSLMTYLVSKGFTIDKTDSDGNPVSLLEPKSGDNILFECSYNTLEIAFAKAKTIQEVDERFTTYLNLIQSYLAPYGHALVGMGINPNWQLNDNSSVKLPRYQMLADYLALGQSSLDCHDLVDYGAYICGNQVQFDVSSGNFLRILNAFNQIEPAKAFLFANSPFPTGDWDTTISRDYFWEHSMHGLIPANVGVYPTDFPTPDAYLTYLTGSALFTTNREGETYYFPPRSLVDYFSSGEILATGLGGEQKSLIPDFADLDNHRSYHYQVLTTRGTVELRSVCTQPLDRTFAPVAFQLGLLVNLDRLETYLASCDFFATYGRDYPALRKQFSSTNLSQSERESIDKFAVDLIQLAKEGLLMRGFKEEIYLNPVL